MRREMDPDEYRAIRELWIKHSVAEDRRDIEGLISTLSTDCVYEIVRLRKKWWGHEGARAFYTELLTAFPDIEFELTNIVIGPQGVSEEADARGTHRAEWLGVAPTGDVARYHVVIFFPWDREQRKFKGERIYIEPATVIRPSKKISFGAFDY